MTVGDLDDLAAMQAAVEEAGRRLAALLLDGDAGLDGWQPIGVVPEAFRVGTRVEVLCRICDSSGHLACPLHGPYRLPLCSPSPASLILSGGF